MKESNFRNKLHDHLDGYTLTTDGIRQAGVSDVVWVCDGDPIWLELKSSDNPPSLPHPVSAPQVDFIQQVQECGAIAGVLCHFPEFIAWQEDFDIGVHHTMDFEVAFESLEEFNQWVKKIRSNK